MVKSPPRSRGLSGPVAGSGKGPDASQAIATLQSRATGTAEPDLELNVLWNDLARVIASIRIQSTGSKGS